MACRVSILTYLIMTHEVYGWVGEFKIAGIVIIELHGVDGDDSGSTADEE